MTATAEIEVECAPTELAITLTPADTTVAVGDSVDFTFTLPDGCQLESITEADTAVVWESSDSSVATVDSLGVATAIDSGEVFIDATLASDPSKSVTGSLTVVPQ